MKSSEVWEKIFGLHVGDYVRFRNWKDKHWYYGILVKCWDDDFRWGIEYRVQCSMYDYFPLFKDDELHLANKRKRKDNVYRRNE